MCYRIEERKQLLNAINDFLDDSVVLPPGDWDSKNLLSVSEIQEMRKRRQKKAEEDAGPKEKEEEKVQTIISGDLNFTKLGRLLHILSIFIFSSRKS